MEKYKYLILGAGPSGLSFANALIEQGETSFLVLEKENEPGGLCRSKFVDGAPLDIGGGHFLDVKSKRVLDYLFRFMPGEEWQLFNRKSSIDFGDYSIDYPLEANIWQMPVEKQVEHIEALAHCGEIRGTPKPARFDEWIEWKLGKRIAEDYMFPYNRKIWSVGLELLGTYWMEKLPSLSFKEIVQSCLTKQQTGRIPAHSSFYYPRHTGYGEVWMRMGQELGSKLILSSPVTSLNIEKREVNHAISADVIINTIPWNSIGLEGMPDDVATAVEGLCQAAIQIDYYPEILQSEDQWIYIPDEKTPWHRILNRRGFIPGAKGYWTETNSKRSVESENMIYINHYAYPLNTVSKPLQIDLVLSYMRKKSIYGLGRWGTWEHINSDVAVLRALELAESLISTLRK